MANETASARVRPQFRNLGLAQIRTYRLPPAGIVSILHRVSGVLLFLALPLLLWLFELSLKTESTYERLRTTAGNVVVKLMLLALIWAILHHFVAGIRYLVLDLHIGIAKEPARKSALLVLAVSLPLALLVGLRMFGVL
ncbi:MAG TPA: succinate dehydrogenase, cytochrome b556 subunit [Burkholderiaceae bacterium]|nr:succinate dehydrogenase, cytochrome b556 subunit [Burkholderiaceae bacterium]